MKRAAAVVLLVVAALAAGCTNTVRATRDLTLTLPWEEYRQVAVQVRNGAVELRSAPVDQIQLKIRKQVCGDTFAQAEEHLGQVEVFTGRDPQNADTFLVELRYPEELAGRNVGACVTIEVPQACAARIRTSNGAIRVAGLTGDVSLETSNGGVQADDVQGTLDARTSNGGIVARRVAGAVQARSSNGGIEALDVSGRCVARTSNGGIRLVAATAEAAQIELITSNGNIHASVPQPLAADMRCETSNGRVSVDLPKAVMQSIQASRTRFSGVVNGGGGKLVAETSNGSVTVDAR